MLRQWQQPAPVIDADDWHALRFRLAPDLTNLASRSGYVEVQLLSDDAQPVYFDSLTIRQPQAGLLVVQEQHYYPFGLPLRGVAVNTVAQSQPSKQQFNGGSELIFTTGRS